MNVPGIDLVLALANDGLGGVFAGGSTEGDLLDHVGLKDAWLIRFNSSGDRLWTLQPGSVDDDELTALAPDGAGGVFGCGTTRGNLGGAGQGSTDVWIARFTGTGSQLWIRHLGSTQFDSLTAAATDGAGGVYVGGQTSGSLGGPPSGSTDAWVARLDGAGNELWRRQWGNSATDSLKGMAPDMAGGVYVVYSFFEQISSSSRAFIRRINGAGETMWEVESPATDWHSVAPDGEGGAWAGGDYTTYPPPLFAFPMLRIHRVDSQGRWVFDSFLDSEEEGWYEVLAAHEGGGLYAYGEFLSHGYLLQRLDESAGELWVQPSNTLACMVGDGHEGLFTGSPGARITLYSAVWVDAAHTARETGSFSEPYNTLAEGIAAVSPGGLIRIKAGSGPETGTYVDPCTVTSHGGPATIGR